MARSKKKKIDKIVVWELSAHKNLIMNHKSFGNGAWTTPVRGAGFQSASDGAGSSDSGGGSGRGFKERFLTQNDLTYQKWGPLDGAKMA